MKSSCQQVSKLVSDAHERPLSPGERLRLRLHLFICGMCRAYARDIRLLKSICGLLEKTAVNDSTCMSDADRARIREALLGAEKKDRENAHPEDTG